MEYKVSEIEEGIKLHKIDTNKFKTNLISVFLTTKLSREDITKKAIILAVLRRGTKNLQSQEEINTKLEELYGAELDCGIDKMGDNHVLKFYIESLNDNFIYKKENILEESINLLFDIIFNPVLENDKFKQEYVEGEKKNIKQIIEAKKDNKAKYALDRCIEEMYKDETYGIYKYGYAEDLENITAENLYKTYKELISNCKIDIFASGEFEENNNSESKNVEEIIKKEIKKYNIEKRIPDYVKDNPKKVNQNKENIVTERMDISQGKLVIGLDLDGMERKNRIVATIYNAILGGGANSKLFQNVREKASLAYTAGSMYIKTKDIVIIRSGIENKNYDQAIEIIKQQLEDMKKGQFDDKDIQNAKELIISSYKSMQDEQDSEISYYFGKEIEQEDSDVGKAIKRVENVSKEEIVNIASKEKINTIYFLTKTE